MAEAVAVCRAVLVSLYHFHTGCIVEMCGFEYDQIFDLQRGVAEAMLPRRGGFSS